MEMSGREFALAGISAFEHLPDGPAAARIALTHGAGGDRETPGLVALGLALARSGFRVVRFNLPAAEAGRRRPDRPAVAARCIASVARGLAGPAPLFLGGRSFGGRMVSEVLASSEPPAVRGAIFLAYPLRPPGKPDVPPNRVEHLPGIRTPALFLSGGRDPFAPPGLLERVGDEWKRVVRIAGADHGFRVAKAHRDGRTQEAVREQVAGQVARFVTDVLTGGFG